MAKKKQEQAGPVEAAETEASRKHEFDHVPAAAEPDSAAAAVEIADEEPKKIRFKRVDKAKGALRLGWVGYSRAFKGAGPWGADAKEWAALERSGYFEEVSA